MSSSAYQEWVGSRKSRIDELLSAHASVGGSGRGRRWRTEQLNWSITMRLAGEFQGFARELHDQAIDCVVSQVAISNPTLGNIVRISMSRDRSLDRVNANPSALQKNFSHLGLILWSALDTASRGRSNRWKTELESLNLARNAIAHDDQKNFLKLQAAGKFPITLSTVKTWRRSLDSLTVTMDDVVGSYLGNVIGGPRPW
jgi:hypothetical protein